MIIGLNGYAGSGKNTVARIIQETFGNDHDIREDSFAARLKLSAIRNFFPTIETEQAIELANHMKTNGKIILMLDGERACAVSGREFLQHYGTEAHRDVFGDDFWVGQLLSSDALDGCDLFLITDVRFPNEADAIRALGGEIWRVNRDEVAPANQHSSEQRLADYMIDEEIDNNGDLADLVDEVVEIVSGRGFSFSNLIMRGGAP